MIGVDFAEKDLIKRGLLSSLVIIITFQSLAKYNNIGSSFYLI